MTIATLADDDPMVRIGLNLIPKGEDGIDVAWQAGDSAEALTKLRDRPIDVVLLNVWMPGLDGLATLEELCGWQTRPRVIVLTTFNIDNYVVQALKLGAGTFLPKDADPAHLVEVIQRVAASKNVLTLDVTHTPIIVTTDAPAARDSSARALAAALTECGREVAVLMTQGPTNNQIDTRLYLSLAPVKSHLTSLPARLGVDNRVSAAMIIRDAGLWNQCNPRDAPLPEGTAHPICHAMCCSTTTRQGDPVLQEL